MLYAKSARLSSMLNCKQCPLTFVFSYELLQMFRGFGSLGEIAQTGFPPSNMKLNGGKKASIPVPPFAKQSAELRTSN